MQLLTCLFFSFSVKLSGKSQSQQGQRLFLFRLEGTPKLSWVCSYFFIFFSCFSGFSEFSIEFWSFGSVFIFGFNKLVILLVKSFGFFCFFDEKFAELQTFAFEFKGLEYFIFLSFSSPRTRAGWKVVNNFSISWKTSMLGGLL